MIPSWYDVLGVDDDATTDEIRSAWQEAVAGLDPTDRRFKQRNRAAEVLLDPDRRAAHDRELAAQDDDEDDWAADQPAAVARATDGADETPADQADQPAPATKATAVSNTTALTKTTIVPVVTEVPEVSQTDAAADADGPLDEDPAPASDNVAGERSGLPAGRVRLTIGLGVLALVLLVATLAALVLGGPAEESAAGGGGLPDARQVEAARKAAETAVGPVLSYDYRDLDKSFAAAKSFMTPHYRDVYDQNVGGYVKDNAPTTKTIVTAEVVSSGIVRTGKDRVDVLVFVNRPTRNATRDEVSRDQVTVRMLDVDDRWLVDCLITEPGGTC
jgi:Mce-associated membrane protein